VSDAIIRIGFVPLVDCAPLALAHELGMFHRNRLDVELRKAQSWIQVQDKLLAGEWDAAHALITMPLQFALKAPSSKPPVSYAFTLSRNGNGIILANALWNEGVRDAVGLSGWLSQRPGRSLKLGVVFPRGTQEYFLRTWLATGGLMLGERISLTIIPPQEMVGRLRKGEIDGFCAGEPWSRRASASKLGRLVAESGRLLPGLGEKVLGVRTEWHRAHALEHSKLIRALSQASAWLADPANRSQAVEIISSKRYVNTPRSVVEGALDDAAARSPVPGSVPQGSVPQGGPAEARFLGGGLNAPSRVHAQWYLDRMREWGHADATVARGLDLSSICMDGFYHSVTSMPAQTPQTPVVTGSAADR
jgi:ABC-type nitrate/sulfonate/bicarbonate transport system substrate-binding protein